MRGFLLSLDAIAASAILLILGLFIAAFSFQLGNEELEIKQVYYTGKDITNILFTATVQDLKEFPVVQEHFTNGTLTSADNNKTLLEVIGYWWSIGNTSQASTLTTQIIDQLLNGTVYGYEITIDGTTIFSRPKPGAKQISQSSYLISGFSLGQQPEGVVASAYATVVNANNSMILDIGPEGSGVDSGQGVQISKQFYLNSSALSLASAPQYTGRIYISLAHGPNSINLNAVKMNGNIVPMIWQYDSDRGTGKLSYGSGDFTSFLLWNQWNELELNFDGHTLGDARTRPGSLLDITYTQNITDFAASDVEDKIVYLDDIISNGSFGKSSGAWAIIPFTIPPGALVTNATLFIHAEEVNNVSNLPAIPSSGNLQKANVMVFLNDQQIDAYNPGKLGKPPQTEYEAYRYLDLLHINATGGGSGLPGGNAVVNVSVGTNVLSVYINCYNISFWGILNTHIYSSPTNDSKNSSFLRITYTKPASEKKFGYITVAAKKYANGNNPSNPNNITLTLNETKLYRTFLHLAQLDSSNVTVNLNTTGVGTGVFVTPRPFATPTTVYIPADLFNTSGTTRLYLQDKCTDQCYFVPRTFLEYYPWVPSLVGYGKLFPNESEATKDAVQRLRSAMGAYANASEVINVTENVPGIQTLWGPAKMDVRVWL